MESQNQEIVASGSPAEVPNDPGKMFIGGLSWQTSPGEHYLTIINRSYLSSSTARLINAGKFHYTFRRV
ncbi:hypothetical protein KPH14_000980 [Odynerus spinipes]|uniref:Uncharacterized protein n=1 Tax=Odynerus spinipes TaxID=1348599 RepID=A0AAD9R8Z9_9HYME|nr:hypothetical protein KPH14_000980 [Odynerus spinipes]